MVDDHRQRILLAAARVYAVQGWRGATTRRIAEEAGVNEVTLFRQFGSKEALLDLMMHECSRIDEAAILPREPSEPGAELLHWVSAHHAGLSGRRAMVRQMMSDAEERPDAGHCAAHNASSAAAHLREYVVQRRRHGWILAGDEITPTEVRAAVTLLMGAVFADAMNRDIMPMLYTEPLDDTLRAYVRIFLRGIGAPKEPVALRERTVDRLPSSTFPFSV